MNAADDSIKRIAKQLDSAQISASPVHQPSESIPLSIADAYRVQNSLLDCRERRGERRRGLKLGFTSRAKMRQMGVDSVIVGQLTDAMQISDGGDLRSEKLIHPRVEPEVAFLVGSDIDLGDTRATVVIDAVAPALEIIDSRYRDFKFSCADVIADNTSAAHFSVGAWQSIRRIDNLAVRMTARGATATVGSTAAILGDPLRGMPLLMDIARTYGLRIAAGDVVLAGAATAAVPLHHGVVTVEVAELGRVSVSTAQKGQRDVPG